MDNLMPKFRPYRGTEARIIEKPYQAGYIYFATDTGHIFLDYNGTRLNMGGSGASIYYANDSKVEADLLDHYLIDFNTLDDTSAAVKVGDLIINTDGSFYKVLEVNEDKEFYECSRIAISGSGGGGGGGGGGDTPTLNYTTLENLEEIPYTFVYGQKRELRFKATAEFDSRIGISVQIDGLNDQTKILTQQVFSGEEFYIDLGSELFLGTNRIVITATTDNSGSAEKRFLQRTSIILNLKKDSSFNPRVVRNGALSFSCVPVGEVDKTLLVSVDGIPINDGEVIKANHSDRSYTTNIPAQAHGVHQVTAVITANVGNVDITTETISYQIAWYENGNTTPLVWFPEGYPQEIVQYEDLNIEFMVWHPEQTTEIETRFYKNTEEISSSPRYLSYNSATTQRWNITDYDIGLNSYIIQVGSTSKGITVNVKEDTERDLTIIKGGLVLNLEALGRSNEESISSRSSWISKDTEKATAAIFNNFNWYNNGWIADANGRSCLRISNGASVSIPLTGLNILNSDDIEDSLAFEFRFKVRNIKEYSTLVTTESTEDAAGNVVVIKNVSTEKGVWGRLYNDLGICLGTQEAFFKSTNAIVNARYREDEIINLTVVLDNNTSSLPLMYIYLQGILSGITKYGESDSFNSNAVSLDFNSDYCDVDLYNVRIYKGSKLESSDVIHNVIADGKDAKAYDINQITTTTNNVPIIDYTKMIEYNAAHPDETIIPYMVITSKDSDNLLPFVKGGKKPVDIEFVNPALDYAYENGLITDEEYIYGAPSFTYSSMGKSFDVQGTSSQGYPRRNYKWKAKQEDAVWRYKNGPLKGQPIYEYDSSTGKYVGAELNENSYKKFYLDSDIGETTFCLKADYMESSGTHNTGYASYVSTLYNKHPLKDYLPSGTVLPSSIRTTIYGFPILVFQKTGNNTYDFIGRYNFNLDKGATDSCGFSYEGDSKVKKEDGTYYPLEEIAECWEICNNQGARTSFTKVDFEETADSYSKIELTTETFKPNVYYYISHIDSSGNETYTLATEFNANDIYYTRTSGVLSVIEDFEYRYSYYEDEIDHAIEGTDEFAGKTQAERNAAILHRMRNFKDLAVWLESTDIQDENKLGNILPAPVIYGSVEYTHDTKDYRLAKFAAEFNQHFDLEYCTIYFITTELFHLYDSRGKNCMMATWGPQVEGGNYIWYPIFYDIDTQLGINNSGVPTWDYYIEATEDNQFSTSNSVLWYNMWQDSTFKNHIKNRYVELRKNNLTIAHMDGYYNSHPILGQGNINSWNEILSDVENVEQLKDSIISYGKLGKKPAMIYNVDQYFKYIAPAVSGYINTSGKTAWTETFFYCLQGSRELMRYLYLRNRLNFIDSKWLGGSYSKEGILGELKGRYDANFKESTSDKYIRTSNPELHGQEGTDNLAGYTLWYNEEYGPHPLDCAVDFKGIRTFLKQYVSIQIDENILTPIPCDGVNSIDLKVPDKETAILETPAFTQQLFYLGGGEYIADLGDLGIKYLDEFAAPTLKRLQRLQLGSDIPGYFNAQLNSSNLSIGANAYTGEGEINPDAKTLLEEVILTGLTTYNAEVDLSGSEKLKTLRALNTAIVGANLADGVQIETLHLPNTITSIKLIEPVALSGILTEPGDLENGFNKGLYIEGITNETVDYNEGINIITYDIVGGNLGYDSYKLLERLVEFKKTSIEDKNDKPKKLAINLKNVNWSPYTIVEYGEPYYPEKADLYYRDENRYKLEKYQYEEATWEPGTKNGKIYLYNPDYFTANENILTDLSLFDTFISSYETALDYYNKNDNSLLKNYFTNTVPNNTKPSLPEISGLIYINNTEAIDEATIANTYAKYFPKVQFFLKNVDNSYRASYVTLIDGVETLIYTEIKSTSDTDLSLTYPPDEYTPIRLNYDFMGWSENKDALPGTSEVYHKDYTDNFETEWAKLQYDNADTYYKFYAIFSPTIYNIRFMNYYEADGREEEVYIKQVEAGTAIGYPNVLPSTDESKLADEIRYKHLGWVIDPKNCFPDSISAGERYLVDLNNTLAENMDRKFYACYIQENVYDSVTDLNLFNFISKGYKDSYGDTSFDLAEGYSISVKNGVVLNGKITIPNSYNGKPVHTIDKIGTYTMVNENNVEVTIAHKITHIFFEKEADGSANKSIRAFTSISGNTELVYIEYPTTLRRLEGGCLSSNIKLRHPDELGNTSVVYAGGGVYTGSFDMSLGPIDVFNIPSTLISMDSKAFAYIHYSVENGGNYRINNVVFGSEESPYWKNNNELTLYNPNSNQILAQTYRYGGAIQDPANTPESNLTIQKFTIYTDEFCDTSTAVERFNEFLKKHFMLEAMYDLGYEIAVVTPSTTVTSP